jgi:hypothetical protein
MQTCIHATLNVSKSHVNENGSLPWTSYVENEIFVSNVGGDAQKMKCIEFQCKVDIDIQPPSRFFNV